MSLKKKSSHQRYWNSKDLINIFGFFLDFFLGKALHPNQTVAATQ